MKMVKIISALTLFSSSIIASYATADTLVTCTWESGGNAGAQVSWRICHVGSDIPIVETTQYGGGTAHCSIALNNSNYVYYGQCNNETVYRKN